MSRLEKFGSLLNSDVDGILLTSEVNRHYAAGYRISEGMALICKREARYFTDSRYIEDAEKNLPEFQVQMVDREHSYSARLNQTISELGLRVIGFEEEYMTAGELQRLQNVLSAELRPMQDELSAFRQIKEPGELDHIREAQRITDKTFSDILGIIRPGMTEKELKCELIYRLCKNGGEEPAFDPVVVSGPNTSMPHGVAGDRLLQNGDMITLDFGCKIQGYCSDMTRTFALGSATDEMKQVYNIVLRAQQAGLSFTKAGVCGCDIDFVARQVIQDAGYGEFFGHGYGHGVGLEIHENPNCSPSWKKPLPEGSVCSAEPGIYLPGKFGVRIEDLVIITKHGTENLTKSPKSFIIV